MKTVVEAIVLLGRLLTQREIIVYFDKFLKIVISRDFGNKHVYSHSVCGWEGISGQTFIRMPH